MILHGKHLNRSRAFGISALLVFVAETALLIWLAVTNAAGMQWSSQGLTRAWEMILFALVWVVFWAGLMWFQFRRARPELRDRARPNDWPNGRL